MKHTKGTETQDDVLARIQRGHANQYLQHRIAEAEKQNRKLALKIVIASAIVAALFATAAILAVEAFIQESQAQQASTYSVRLVACERQHSEAHCAKAVKR